MRMDLPEDKHMLVRGRVSVSAPNGSYQSLDFNEMQERGGTVAYTHWYRHDDDLEELRRDFDRLIDCYRCMRKTSVLMYGYEYKEYRK